jgi:hypothetical protein
MRIGGNKSKVMGIDKRITPSIEHNGNKIILLKIFVWVLKKALFWK